MTTRLPFKRIVLGLPYKRPGHGMRLAAEVARLLQLDLLGFFVEEESLIGLATLPFIREFGLPGGGWRRLDIDQLSRDLQIAARNAEKDFAEAAKSVQTMCHFEVVRGSMAATIESISGPGDIVLLMEPTSLAEFATPQFISTLDAAFRSSAAVLLVPARVARHSGAIVAIADEPNDPSIEAARVVATAAKEDLTIIELFKAAGKIRDPEIHLHADSRADQLPDAQRSLADASAIAYALGPLHERLLVMTRRDNSVPLLLASMRQVPVLIIEPAERQDDLQSSR
jgi:hypothetical protein